MVCSWVSSFLCWFVIVCINCCIMRFMFSNCWDSWEDGISGLDLGVWGGDFSMVSEIGLRDLLGYWWSGETSSRFWELLPCMKGDLDKGDGWNATLSHKQTQAQVGWISFLTGLVLNTKCFLDLSLRNGVYLHVGYNRCDRGGLPVSGRAIK